VLGARLDQKGGRSVDGVDIVAIWVLFAIAVISFGALSR